MATVSVSTELAAPAALVWQGAKTPHAFVHVASGMLRFPAAEQIDGPWQEGDRLAGWILLFGFVPISVHHLRVESIDEASRTLVSDERGGLIRRWRHEVFVTVLDANRCRCEDRIEIDAGALTPLVTAFASVFYRDRQRRWRALARLLAATAWRSDDPTRRVRVADEPLPDAAAATMAHGAISDDERRALASTCSTLRQPGMTQVTAGCCRHQASAHVALSTTWTASAPTSYAWLVR